MPQSWCARLLGAGAVAFALFLTRWPLLSPFLTSFDAANFAFALDDFNPAEHKPQPPGYPLYVGLARLIRAYVEDPVFVFAIAGFIGALAAVLLVRELAAEMFGPAAAWPAAMVLLVHPVLWAAGLMNPVRVFLAAGSACVAWFAWRAWHPGSARIWLWSAAAALGIASGFRPSLVLLCMPLLIVTAWRRQSSLVDWGVAAIALLGGIASWVWVAAQASGGIVSYVELLRGYADEQFAPSSAIFGASLWPAVKMAGRCIAWIAIPSVLWLWMLPGIGWTRLRQTTTATGLFFLLWLLPPLLLYTLIHSAEPGHILPLVVPVCVIAGYVIAAWSEKRPWGAALPCAVAAIALLNAWMFFRPPLRVQTLSSIAVVDDVRTRVGGTLAILNELAAKGPVVVLASPSSSVAWRILSYYHPNELVAVLRTDPETAAPAGHFLVRGRNLVSSGTTAFSIPDCGKLMWLRSPKSATHLDPSIQQRSTGDIVVADLRPDVSITLGPYRITTAAGSCASTLSAR